MVTGYIVRMLIYSIWIGCIGTRSSLGLFYAQLNLPMCPLELESPPFIRPPRPLRAT